MPSIEIRKIGTRKMAEMPSTPTLNSAPGIDQGSDRSTRPIGPEPADAPQPKPRPHHGQQGGHPLPDHRGPAHQAEEPLDATRTIPTSTSDSLTTYLILCEQDGARAGARRAASMIYTIWPLIFPE